ncbi:MAG TPA: hypothetical protein VHR42_05210 [Clostridia bacterium]|nr:hypothetical protein [Clostridia bacterium]
MNLAAVDCDEKANERIPRLLENINVLIVQNGNGGAVRFYDAKQLTRRWLSMGQQQFALLYGFDWKPPELLQCLVRLHM